MSKSVLITIVLIAIAALIVSQQIGNKNATASTQVKSDAAINPRNSLPQIQAQSSSDQHTVVDTRLETNQFKLETEGGEAKFDRDGMIPTDRAIGLMKDRIAKNPHDYMSMTVLGQLQMRDAKDRDDHQSYVAAESSFKQAIATNKTGAKAAHVHLIAALHAQHKFQQAQQQAKTALEIVPGNLVAVAGLGDAQMELGNLDEADKEFQKVADQFQTPGVLARLARMAEFKGESEAAIEFIRQARTKSIAENERNETTAWYDFRLGLLYFGKGDLEAAENEFRSGIARSKDETRSMDGLAKVLIAKQQCHEAEQLYRRSLAIVEAPPTIAAFGDLLNFLGRVEEASQNWDRASELMAEEAETTGVAHYRERARFLLQHDRDLDLALELAQKDLKLRQDVYAHDTLAWALYKNKRFDEAKHESLKAMKTGLRDAEIFYHAGMIAFELKDTVLANEYLSKCLEINPNFDIANANLAKTTLAEIKDRTTHVSTAR